jgi:hypothetical protein
MPFFFDYSQEKFYKPRKQKHFSFYFLETFLDTFSPSVTFDFLFSFLVVQLFTFFSSFRIC